AGWLRTGNSMRAVQVFRRQRLFRGDDPLWLIALASAEESAGYPVRARRIREDAWRLLLKTSPNSAEPPTEPSIPAEASQSELARVHLAPAYFNADYPRAVLIQLLREDAQRMSQSPAQLSVLGNI